MASTCWKRSSCQTICSYGTPRSAATARSRSTIVIRPFGDRLARYAAVGSVCGAWTAATADSARGRVLAHVDGARLVPHHHPLSPTNVMSSATRAAPGSLAQPNGT